jgi:MYXO-CTERM domain-containing protein
VVATTTSMVVRLASCIRALASCASWVLLASSCSPQGPAPTEPIGIVIESATIGQEISLEIGALTATPELDNYPDAASDGAGTTLVVWTLAQTVLGKRVDTTGTPIDSDPIVIAARSTALALPKVAYGSGAWLVTWQEGDGVGSDIFGARVDVQGTIVDAAPLPICTAAGVQTGPALAHAGSQWLVAWTDARSTNSVVYAARVEDDGDVLEADGKPILRSPNPQAGPKVAAAGDSFFAAWSDGDFGANQDIVGARVDATLTSLDPSGLLLATGTGQRWTGGIAFSGGAWLVGWSEPSAASVVRVGADGTVLDQTPTLVRLGEYPTLTGILPTADGWVALTGSSVGLVGSRINAHGDATGSTFQVTPGDTNSASLVDDGTHWLAVWNRVTSSDTYGIEASDIFVRGMGTDVQGITPGSPGLLLTTVPTQTRAPAVAFGKDDFLLVWSDDRYPGPSLWGSRVRRDGELRDGSGFPLQRGSVPAVASNGSDWLVASVDARANALQWSRVNASGSRAATGEHVRLNRIRGAADIASNGKDWFIVWSEQKVSMPPIVSLMGVRLSGDASVLSLPVQIASDTPAFPFQAAPRVAFGSGGFLVTWREHGTILGARVDAEGSLLDATPISIADSPGSTDVPAPDVAANAREWLVTWQDARAGSPGIFGVRVDSRGNVLDPVPLTIADGPAAEREPAIARSGLGWMVAWGEPTNGQDVRAARVQSGGGLLDPGGFLVSEHPLWEGSFALAEGRGGDHLVAYQRNDPDRAPHESVKARIVHVDCVPLASTDATCDGVDDDCSGAADEDYEPITVGCPNDRCTPTGRTSCAGGFIRNDCAPAGDEPCAAGGAGGSPGDDAGKGGREPGTGGDGQAGRGGSTASGGSTANGGGTAGSDTNGEEGGAGGERDHDGAGEAGQSTRGGAPATSGPRRRSGCGCRTAGAPESRGGALSFMLLALGALKRRRARAQS